ncbi:hypothetical protein NOCA2270131 [metagenome]|uniref:Uncharacterized protein n=1 Tax=metagenome TaxID=256318 RepID=A0A2P2C0I2_9ZZZZ
MRTEREVYIQTAMFCLCEVKPPPMMSVKVHIVFCD